MKISLQKIKPSPFRNFELYPLDEHQVEVLVTAFKNNGMAGSLAVRRATQTGYYELVWGHHRYEAAQRSGFKEIEVTLHDYDDDQMVDHMISENATQHPTSASTLDGVYAKSKRIAVEYLLGDENVTRKILRVTSDTRTLARTQSKIANEGPGIDLLYREINGFDLKERREKKDVEQPELLSEPQIKSALLDLKHSGKMAQIIADAQTEVASIHEARAVALAEAELERLRKEAAEAKEAEDRAAADKKANAEQQQKAAKESAAADQRAKDRAKTEDKRKSDSAAKEAQDKLDRDQKAAEAQENAIWDARCASVFPTPSHKDAFRQLILDKDKAKYVPRDQQYAFAIKINHEMEQHAKLGGKKPDVQFLKQLVNEAVAKLAEKDKEEQKKLKQRTAIDRVDTYWKNINSGMRKVTKALEDIIEEGQKWEENGHDPSHFPIHNEIEALERMAVSIATKVKQIRQLDARTLPVRAKRLSTESNLKLLKSVANG